MSDSVRPHRRQPTRLLRPWDSPGKNTGVGHHFLLQCMKVESESEVVQSCPTLSDPMDCSPPGSSIHGSFQARVRCMLTRSWTIQQKLLKYAVKSFQGKTGQKWVFFFLILQCLVWRAIHSKCWIMSLLTIGFSPTAVTWGHECNRLWWSEPDHLSWHSCKSWHARCVYQFLTGRYLWLGLSLERVRRRRWEVPAGSFRLKDHRHQYLDVWSLEVGYSGKSL